MSMTKQSLKGRQDAVNAIFPSCAVTPLVEDWEKGSARFEVWQMYNRPEVSYEVMEQVASIFGTKMLSLSDGRNISGCDTCDYGSERGLVFDLWDIDFDALNGNGALDSGNDESA